MAGWYLRSHIDGWVHKSGEIQDSFSQIWKGEWEKKKRKGRHPKAEFKKTKEKGICRKSMVVAWINKSAIAKCRLYHSKCNYPEFPYPHTSAYAIAIALPVFLGSSRLTRARRYIHTFMYLCILAWEWDRDSLARFTPDPSIQSQPFETSAVEGPCNGPSSA